MSLPETGKFCSMPIVSAGNTALLRAASRASIAAALLAAGGSAAMAAATETGGAVIATASAETALAGAETIDPPGEILVTARRREERAQDVPIALSVIGGEQIAARGDYRLDQIQQIVPSLQVFSFNPRNTNINIRGLGSNVALTNDGLENGVGLYIDNVYYGRVGQSQFDLVDLDRIEVLRGPQGTLFGKNTTAGAINITSRLPRFDPSFDGEATGGNFGYHQVRGSLTGGLIDDLLAARISVADTHRDGFIRNVTTGRKVHDYDNFSVRGQLLLTPAERLTVRVIGDYSKQQQECCINLLTTSFNTYDNGATIANNFTQRVARAGYTPLPFDPFARRTDANGHFQANMNTWGVSGQVDYDLGRAALTAITAVRHWNWYPANDSDATALDVNVRNQQQNFQRQFSQEVRLASTGTNRIDYVVGAYYFWQVVRGIGSTAYGTQAANWLFPAQPAAVSNAAVNGFASASTSSPETRSYALFGQTVWHATDRLSLTTGLRYTYERKNGAFTQAQVAGLPLTGLTAAQAATAQALRNSLAPITSYAVRAKDGSLSGLVTLGWKPVDDVLVYATYSRGNKSQGLNLTTLPAGVGAVVAPEKVDSYEVGVKSTLFDRAVTLNLAGFWTDITDYQTTIVQQVVGTNSYINYISNIPKARSRGFEGDLAWRLSRDIGLTGSLAYTDAYYVEYPNGPTPVEALNPTPANPAGTPTSDFSGKPLAGVPKWAASVGGDAGTPLGDTRLGALTLYAHADYAYRSAYFTAASNSRYSRVPGYGVVNGRIGVKLDDGRWDLAVWAKNLLDKNYFQTLTVQNYGLVTAILGDPRTIGVTLRTKL